MPRPVVSDLGLPRCVPHCVPMSHTEDARIV